MLINVMSFLVWDTAYYSHLSTLIRVYDILIATGFNESYCIRYHLLAEMI